MRKLAWSFIILTLLAWLAIARYWTGTNVSESIPLDVPSRPITVPTGTPLISPEVTPLLISTPSANTATKSGTPTPSLVY